MAFVKSYLDTTLRIIHINRRSGFPSKVLESIRQQIISSETSSPFRREFIQRHLAAEHQQNEELLKILSHEFHHYLQGLFYPFLYYLSWLEFDTLLYLGSELKHSPEESFKIEQIHMHKDFFLNFKFLYHRTEFFWEGDHLRVKIPEAGLNSINVFTLNDLLEDATTIFEYRINTESPTSEGFDKWISNPANNCYKKTYRFLQTAWGNQLAFKVLPLLVQVTFSCTDPLTGFCAGVSYINFNYSYCYEQEPEELFYEIMAFLERKIGTVILKTDEHYLILNIPVGVLRYEDMGNVIAKADGSRDVLSYPLNLHFKKLVERIKTEPTHQSSILQITKASFDGLLESYYPFAVHYHYQDFDGRNGVLVMGEDYRDEKSPHGVAYPLYVKELIKIKETHLALFSRIHTSIDNNCHHKQCSYYPLGLCKLWNSIPYDHLKCGFPYWFAYLFHRRIDLILKTLVKIDRKEVDDSYEEYERRSFKSRTFEYIRLDNGYLLTIDSPAITDESMKTMFPDFVAFLKSKFQETNESLLARINLDFFGYNYDPRPLFEIPEVVSFIQESKKLIPELLYYINFNASVDHRFILLPMFVEHETTNKDGQFQVAFNSESLNKFALEEMNIWRKFLLESKIPPTKPIFENLKSLLQ